MTDTYERREGLNRDAIIDDFTSVVETISRSMVQVFSRQLAPEGITVLQYHALRALWMSDSELDMSTIATLSGLPASSVTSVIDRLCEHGLVERKHSEADRRRVVARVTAQGDALMERLQQLQHEDLVTMLAQSTTDDLAACVRVFQRIDEHLRAQLPTRPGAEP